MAKIGKLVAIAALIGAAGAGAYYYFKSKEEEFDDFDDFDDDFDEDDDFEEDTAIEASEPKSEKVVKEYIPLKISKEDVIDAKETIQKAAKEVSEQSVSKYEFENLTE